jgi:hypothetical protein
MKTRNRSPARQRGDEERRSRGINNLYPRLQRSYHEHSGPVVGSPAALIEKQDYPAGWRWTLGVAWFVSLGAIEARETLFDSSRFGGIGGLREPIGKQAQRSGPKSSPQLTRMANSPVSATPFFPLHMRAAARLPTPPGEQTSDRLPGRS